MYATMADAHREWHLNTGVPMGQPGCPQDACHPPEPEADVTQIRCGHCRVYHWNVAEVRQCSLTRTLRG